MADFKIKSAVGTGNKTLLQSQDQTGSNYAIQVGDAGATTLTNATLTNATLTTATMSAGSIGSAVTGFTGIKESDSWIVSVAFSGEAQPITSNWARNAYGNFTLLGTGMTQSSGTFTFPSTGRWLVIYDTYHSTASADIRYIGMNMRLSTNTGSSYADVATKYASIAKITGGSTYQSQSCHAVINVANISTYKINFGISGNPTGFSTGGGWTGASFIRIGDT